MKIAIYSRKSKFTGKGDSIENQVQMCKEFCLSHMQEITEGDFYTFEDEGFSGKNLERPEFQKMMDLVNQDFFQYVVCYRLDRISRNISDFSALIQKLERRKTAFICIKEQFDTSTPMGRAMMYIASVFSQLERETIAERIRDNMIYLAKSGRWLGGTPPLGYQSKKKECFYLNGKHHHSYQLTPNQKDLETVKYLYQEFLYHPSLSYVESLMDQNGFLTAQRKKFKTTAIKDILQNPVYCAADKNSYNYFLKQGTVLTDCFQKFDGKHGLISYNKRDYSGNCHKRRKRSDWIIAIGSHTGLIDGEKWVKVQTILDSNHSLPISTNRVCCTDSLLSGLLLCERCQRRMVVKKRRKQNQTNCQTFSYLCKGKLIPGSNCSVPNLDGPKADKIVFDTIVSLFRPNSDFFVNIKKLSDFNQKNKLSPTEEMKKQLNHINNEMETIISNLSKSKSPILLKYLEPRLEELDFKYNNLINEMNTNSYSESETIDPVPNWLFPSFASSLPIEKKRELLHSLIKEITWDGICLRLVFYSKEC